MASPWNEMVAYAKTLGITKRMKKAELQAAITAAGGKWDKPLTAAAPATTAAAPATDDAEKKKKAAAAKKRKAAAAKKKADAATGSGNAKKSSSYSDKFRLHRMVSHFQDTAR